MDDSNTEEYDVTAGGSRQVPPADVNRTASGPADVSHRA